MNNNFFIFVGLFILFLMLGVIILLYYIYKTYTIYKNNIDNNFLISENNINNTSVAFDKLQDDINNKLNNINEKNNQFMINEPKKLNVLNSNLNTLFNINNFNDFMNSNLPSSDNINIKMNSKIINYSGITNLTDNTNYFKICDNSLNENTRKCINLNVDNSGNFNIYPGLNNTSNISSLSIFNNNKKVLAKFDLNSNIISLGSDNNPAISINNNIYTPNIIICNYTFTSRTSNESAKINLSYISNFNLQKETYLNFIIDSSSSNDFYLCNNSSISDIRIDITKINYTKPILKLYIKSQISANSITPLSLNIIANNPNNPINNQLTSRTTNGYLSLS